MSSYDCSNLFDGALVYGTPEYYRAITALGFRSKYHNENPNRNWRQSALTNDEMLKSNVPILRIRAEFNKARDVLRFIEELFSKNDKATIDFLRIFFSRYVYDYLVDRYYDGRPTRPKRNAQRYRDFYIANIKKIYELTGKVVYVTLETATFAKENNIDVSDATYSEI